MVETCPLCLGASVLSMVLRLFYLGRGEEESEEQLELTETVLQKPINGGALHYNWIKPFLNWNKSSVIYHFRRVFAAKIFQF